MASTLVALQTVTVGAGGSANISFTSIPQTYTDLVVKISARAVNSGAQNILVSFNGLSNNFSSVLLYGTGSAAASIAYPPNTPTNTSAVLGGSNYTANTFGSAEIYIPNYAGSTYKSFSTDSTTENNATESYIEPFAQLWSQIAAITSIGLTPVSGNFAQYSTFTLYGVYKDAAETTPAAPTIGTATAGSQAADVAFTPAGSGAPASSYVVTSSPGGLTATGASSPIQINGLTSGTAYTFTVRGQNPGGLGAASAASNSVTPYDGYESIATLYPTGTTATFSSIPSTYTHLQVRCITRTSAAVTAANLRAEVNGDTGANYSYHLLGGDGSSAFAGAGSSQNYISYIGSSPGTSITSGIFGVTVIDILDYKDTNKFKTLRSLGGTDTNNTNGQVVLASALWRSTSAITSISFYSSSGNFTSGSTFELFGIRG